MQDQVFRSIVTSPGVALTAAVDIAARGGHPGKKGKQHL